MMSAFAANASPIAICDRPKKWRGCSPDIPTLSRGRWRSSIAARSICANCATSIRPSSRILRLTPQQTLEKLTWEGAVQRFPEGVPDDVAAQLRHELALIARARIRAVFPDGQQHRSLRAIEEHPLPGTRIRCQLRRLLRARHHQHRSGAQRPAVRDGSSRQSGANRPTSMSISSMSGARKSSSGSMNTYGRDRAALCATIIRYRTRGAVREVGKAMGLTEDVTVALASQVWGWSEDGVRRGAGGGTQPEPRRPAAAPDTGTVARADRLSPPPQSASGRLRSDA